MQIVTFGRNDIMLVIVVLNEAIIWKYIQEQEPHDIAMNN